MKYTDTVVLCTFGKWPHEHLQCIDCGKSRLRVRYTEAISAYVHDDGSICKKGATDDDK